MTGLRNHETYYMTIITNDAKYDAIPLWKEKIFVVNGKNLIENEHLINLNWKKHNHKYISFKNCTISASDFGGSCLEGLHLEDCHIYNCSFERAILRDGIFKNCIFYEKENQLGSSFYLADLQQTQWYNCNISLNNFERADLFQVSMNSCQAIGCNFKNANFSNMINRSSFFCMASLVNTDFNYSDFSCVNLEKCDLSGSKFVNVDLSGTNLSGTDLKNTDFAPAYYNNLSLIGADMRNANISSIDVRKLEFSGVKILDWQQGTFIENLGIIISPENKANLKKEKY